MGDRIWSGTKTAATNASGAVSGSPRWTAPTSRPITIASSAGRIPRSASTVHQAAARVASARASTPRNCHSLLATRRVIMAGMAGMAGMVDATSIRIGARGAPALAGAGAQVSSCYGPPLVRPEFRPGRPERGPIAFTPASPAVMTLAVGIAPEFLVQTVAIVVAAAVIAYLSHRIGLVPIVGFLIAGVVIGPHALRLVEDPALVNAAAEIGVILLLFTIGIEFSLDKLARIKTLIFAGGGLQVIARQRSASSVCWSRSASSGARRCSPASSSRCRRPPSSSSCSSDRGETARRTARWRWACSSSRTSRSIVMVLLVPMLGGAGRRSRRDRLGAGQGARADRRGAAGRAPADAAAARAGGA